MTVSGMGLASTSSTQYDETEYVQANSNHVLVVGTGMGVFALLLALAMKSRPAQIVALAVLFLLPAAAFPVLTLGQMGYKNVRKLADEPGQFWLDTHMGRAESLVFIYYLLSLVSAAAIVVPLSRPKTSVPLALGTLVIAGLALAEGTWISQAWEANKAC